MWPQAGFGSNYYQGVATNNVPWPGGTVPYKFDTNVTPTEQTIYLEGMKEWELAANVHFVPYTNQPNYVLLRFDYTQGTDTYIASFPETVMTVDTLSRAQVCHETGHLLGFQHEHVRTDRNTYITVNFTNLIGNGTGSGTNGSGEGSSVSNLYVIDTNSTSFGAYDFESVMHYGRTLFSTDPTTLDTVDPNAPYYGEYYYRIGNYALSPGDRAGAAHLYGLPTTALTNVVTNTADGGFGSLRAALYYANDHPGTTIRFNISTNDAGYSNGVYTISLSGELPPLIANGTVIDATTQPGYTSHPVIALSGSQLNPELAYPNALFNCGLRVYAANCVINGLSIYDFPFLGIAVEYAYAESNRIEGCYIGVAPNSTNAVGNAYQGISIDTGASYNIVGGASASQRNVISGNAQYAILVIGTNGQPGAAKIGTNTVGTVIQGNYIGTDPTGSYAVSNVVGGIWEFNGASGMTVGGTNSAAGSVFPGNVISGNGSAGVFLTGTSNNVVQGNDIGLNAAGTAAVANADSGIYVVSGSSSNLIGGTAAGARNVISGNVNYGIYVSDPGTKNLVVQGNYIGTDPHGATAIGNGFSGIGIWGAATNILVGGTNAGAENLISGNDYGISVGDAGTGGVQIYGNYIGVASNGVAALPNTGIGVYLELGTQNNSIGGTLPGQGNLISGNGSDGVQLYNYGTSFNTIQGNYIGTTKTGLSPLGNGGSAVSFFYGASNTLGGTTAAARNLLCASKDEGVFIYYANNETIQGNYIGVGVDGATPMGNGLTGQFTEPGIYALVSASNLIGGAVAGAGNVISAGGNDAVQFYGSGADYNVVQGNYIGTTATGLTAVGNGASGVSFLYGPQSNTVGGATAAARNVISGNTGVGVYMAGASNIAIQGNYVGVGADGTTPMGNGGVGVYLDTGESNLIGGTVAGDGNVISDNGGDGIQIRDVNTVYNVVQGNLVGTTKTGTNALGNLQSGLSLLYGAQSNTIGGSTAAARNVFTASTYDGVYISGASNNIVQGNYIGTDSTGLHGFGNGYEGIVLNGASAGNQIGGPTAGQGNVIADSTFHGIYISDAGTTGNLIQGNDIGVGADGVTALGNAEQGIILQAGASSNVVGLALNGSGAGNIIAYNTYEGIIVYDAATVGNVLRGNSIHDNGALGINLEGGTEDGYFVTANHPGGAVPGPEDLQDYPVLTTAAVAGGATTIYGTLNSTANRGFLVDVYRNTIPDPSGHGEGQVYVGKANLTTDAGGNGFFALAAAGALTGQYFTATATDATTGDTSEFALDFTATNGTAPFVLYGPYSWSRSNGFSLSMALVSNQNYTVEMTTNLGAVPIVWTSLTNFTATNILYQFTDRSATNQAVRARFYRIESP